MRQVASPRLAERLLERFLVHRALLALLVVVGITGCSATAEEDASQDDGAFELARTLEVGAYFIDGSTNHPEQGSIIFKMSERTDPSVVTHSAYFDGPDLLGLESYSRTEAVARAICDDIKTGRTNMWIVFGFSRGAFIANKAGSLALSRCGRPRPVKSTGLRSQYLYGGFLDAVAMSNDLVDANWVPIDTLFHHLHRKDTESASIMPVTNFGGGIGTNEVGPDLDHVSMGFSQEVEDKLVQEAQRRTGLRLFRPR